MIFINMNSSGSVESLVEMFDVPLMHQIENNPEKIQQIPKDCYERIMKFYEEMEKYELCNRLLTLKDIVVDKTLAEIISEYRVEHDILMYRLLYIIDLLSKSKE
jgi:hypothetical protein